MKNTPIILVLIVLLTSGCSVVRTGGKALHTVGKVGVTTAKIAGKVTFNTAKITGKGIKTVVNMVRGKEVVSLDKRGNSLYVDAILNRRLKTELIVDTGCTNTQISLNMAKKLGIKPNKGEKVLCTVADGRQVVGRAVNIKEVRIAGARVRNVRAVVLEGNQMDRDIGLLGMSFLNNFIFRIDSEKRELILQRR